MTHPVPSAMVRLHQLVRAQVESKTTRVDLGPVAEFDEPDAVAIGLATQTPEAVPGQVIAAGMGSDRYSFDLICSAQSADGDEDLPARMDRVFALVDVVRGVLPALADAVDDVWGAQMSRESFAWVETQQGLGAFVEFAVRIEANRPL